MRSEIVHDDDVIWGEGRGEDLFHVDPEALAIDRPLDQPWCCHPVVAQGGDEGQGLPAPVWHLGQQALATRPPAAQRAHVGFGPRLVDEDQARRIDALLTASPLDPPARYVRTIPLLGDQRLFL